MLKIKKNLNGQILASEYVVVFSVVVGMIVAMTVFVKRSFQARLIDSRDYMIRTVKTQTRGVNLAGNIQAEYEPYYIKQVRLSGSSQNEQSQILPGSQNGVFIKSFSQQYSESKNVIYLPPAEAK
ncbi:MAG: hypothetical protein HQL26_10380 [Candidatus Omnitrophica bacterium]|nr:hypothetical protein [Candidatus Omnitrophota bacterium]